MIHLIRKAIGNHLEGIMLTLLNCQLKEDDYRMLIVKKQQDKIKALTEQNLEDGFTQASVSFITLVEFYDIDK